MQPVKDLYLMSNFSTLDLVDRERLTSRLMTLVGKHYEVHQRGQKRFELIVLLPAEARIEQGFDPADDAGGGQRGGGALAGKELAGLRFEAAGELVHKLDTAPNRSRAGGPGLDHHRAGGIGLATGEAEQGFEGVADAIAPDISALAGGCIELLAQPLGAGVESGEEAVFFVGEVLVEGRAGDAGPVDHVLHVGSEIAQIGGSVEHRDDQPLPLDGADQVRRELADSGGEFAAAVGEQLESDLHLLGRPVVTDRSKQGLLAQLDSIDRHRRTHKFLLKTMEVFSRYQNIGRMRVPLGTAECFRPISEEPAGGSN